MTKTNKVKARPRVIATSLLVACLAMLLMAGSAQALIPIAQFRENQADPNTGLYLWSEASNWTWANTTTLSGLPKIDGQVEVGDDYSGPVSVYMDIPYAECRGVEIAEGYVRRTSGSSMHIPFGSTLDSRSRFQVGKDDKGFLTLDGNLSILPPPDGPSYPHLHIGHYGHSNARGTVTISSTGNMYVDGTVYLLGVRMPGGPWGNDSDIPDELDYGSSLTVDGTLTFRVGMKISSGFRDLPGTFRIDGNATITQNAKYNNFFDLLGGGVMQIDGGNAAINFRMLNVVGDTDYYGNDNPAVIKLSGDGVSTINIVGATTLGSGSVLDVSELNVAPNTYTVIDGASIVDTGLAFAPGTDTSLWSFDVDVASGNLLVTYVPEPASLLLMIAGGMVMRLRRRRR